MNEEYQQKRMISVYLAFSIFYLVVFFNVAFFGISEKGSFELATILSFVRERYKFVSATVFIVVLPLLFHYYDSKKYKGFKNIFIFNILLLFVISLILYFQHFIF